MKKSEFISTLKEVLEIEGKDITEDTNLYGLEEFDSLAVMTVMALIDEKFAKKITADQFTKITSVKSLMELIGMERFDP